MRNGNALCYLVVLLRVVSRTAATASFYVNHWHQYSPSATSYNQRIIRSRRSLTNGENSELHGDAILVAARRTPSKRPQTTASLARSTRFDRHNRSTPDMIVTGTFHVLKDALADYILGFCVGYAVGSLVGIPALLFGPSGPSSHAVSAELKSRLARLNSRSFRWALGWGEVLGTFKGCDTAVQLIRYPKRDIWNPVLGCATAAAVLTRGREYFTCLASWNAAWRCFNLLICAF